MSEKLACSPDQNGTIDLDVEDVPWTTAPEHAEEAMRELDISEGSAVWEHIERLATRYGLERALGGSSPSPASLAAGSIYVVCLLNDLRLTQAAVSDATGVSRVAIRNAYQAICDAEDIPHRGYGRGATVGGESA